MTTSPEPAPLRVVEQRGLYFDELEEGVAYAHRPGRTVTEADNVLFTTLTMNSQALHLDPAWSAAGFAVRAQCHERAADQASGRGRTFAKHRIWRAGNPDRRSPP